MFKYLNFLFFNIKNKISIGVRPKSGRNFTGKICVHHRSGGHKKQYYFIDYFRRINNFGFLYKILQCSNRTAYIGAIIYENGLFSFNILTENIQIGHKIYSGSNYINNDLGNSILLKNISLFSILNNIENYPFFGGSITRSAGTSAILTNKNNNKIIIKLKSGWNLHLSENCIASLGNISNMKHKYICLKKAGKSRSLGIRPTVRGVAMNPCDHPHGGGEGKKSPPSGQLSPWGWLTKGTSSLKKKLEKKKKKLYKKI
jgi:large subunit ribosomal protein L2